MATTFPTLTRVGARLLLAAAGAACAAVAAVTAGCGTSATADAASGDRSSAGIIVRPHTFTRTLRLTGLTESVQSVSITVPILTGSNIGNLTVVQLAAAGSAVKPGDALVTFDRQQQEQLAFDKRAEYQGLVEQIVRTRAEQDAALAKDDAELVQAADAVQHGELEVLKNEMVTRIQAEQNVQQLESARAQLAALRAEYPLRRAAAAAALRVLEIQRDKARAAMLHAEENVRRMVIRSPIAGLVVLKTHWAGKLKDVQEGDQLWPGSALLSIVSQAGMRVRAKVSQADAPLIAAGQAAAVRLDSYPDLPFHGRVEQLGPTAAPGSFSPYVRSFAVLVSIDGAHPRLLPDLSAAVDVEVARTEHALTVPHGAIRWVEGRATVSVKTAHGTEPRPVTIGAANDMETVVTGGLRAGETVVP